MDETGHSFYLEGKRRKNTEQALSFVDQEREEIDGGGVGINKKKAEHFLRGRRNWKK